MGIPRILVVDDDRSIRKIFRINLEEEGYIVETAETGREAMDLIERQFFHIALIDIMLEDMKGTALLDIISEISPWMKKIIVTGFPTLDSAIQAVNKDADGYILKPVNIEQLLQIIKEQLKKQREEEEFNEEIMSKFIESRVRELDTMNKFYKPI